MYSILYFKRLLLLIKFYVHVLNTCIEYIMFSQVFIFDFSSAKILQKVVQ